MEKQILITGGTGYIGSHTAVEFINAGYEVIIIDNLSNSDISVLNGIEKITDIKPIFYKVDVTLKAELRKVFETHPNIQAIVHFAAFKAVGESVEFPLKYYHNNLTGLINILECMEEFKIKNLVFSSSCTIYGQPELLPVTEESPVIKPESPYGNTKRISEEIIQDFLNSTQGFKCISLRYFNPIGAHPSAEIGELPIGVPNNLMPYITQTAYGIREELKVFGSDYNTPDGTPIRDYINVVDLAEAHVAAVNRLLKDKTEDKFEVFNIGTGQGHTVLEVINAFEKNTGVKLKYRITNRRPGDVEKVWADTSKANKILGWKAKKSLAETVKSAWEWEKKYREKTKASI
ncbi:MAG TPA: UDP-glucose 4-epimerase GalE [Bacteroidales bacterium]|nr:UDP-glucose 4-epimerase GalE [Bacteroidales bacterium]HOL98659.1 UDP-glucose 4-epimerase GalE [Bacteroidales bacterium]HOM35906.1 UDP-glucose 4-epimerase GalE [Bacteroidales bacterium]HPD24478.1 UDP-glucose 4-epimerase GalE [Bacteroidales bacterium]HRT00312.1 UDP-glucose 4-epimerase GalE [Bacteroidales bacterium]